MKRLLFTLCIFASILISCEERTRIIDSGGFVASDIAFEPDEIDVYVTPETDVIPFEYSRIYPVLPGKTQDDQRGLIETYDSEAKMFAHYTVDTWIGGGNTYFLIYFQHDSGKGRYEGLHIIPSAIDHNMKLILMNEIGYQKRLTINLIVDKEEQ